MSEDWAECLDYSGISNRQSVIGNW